jgi:hypothetical protein
VDACAVEALKAWSEPTTWKQMWYNFVWFAMDFRQFTCKHNAIAAPLHKMVHYEKFGDV